MEITKEMLEKKVTELVSNIDAFIDKCIEMIGVGVTDEVEYNETFHYCCNIEVTSNDVVEISEFNDRRIILKRGKPGPHVKEVMNLEVRTTADLFRLKRAIEDRNDVINTVSELLDKQKEDVEKFFLS